MLANQNQELPIAVMF